jgi:hypothetical protein|tara:strand:- start:1600 stop:1824 length:225 start_codon:yes stop_codon:yes gene_type:complete
VNPIEYDNLDGERVFLELLHINIITPIGVGRKYDELEIEIGVVKLKLFSNSQFDFSKLDILLCPEIENGIENEK